MDEILESVDGGDLAFTTLVGASGNDDFVVLSDGDAADLEIQICQRLFLILRFLQT